MSYFILFLLDVWRLWTWVWLAVCCRLKVCLTIQLLPAEVYDSLLSKRRPGVDPKHV